MSRHLVPVLLLLAHSACVLVPTRAQAPIGGEQAGKIVLKRLGQGEYLQYLPKRPATRVLVVVHGTPEPGETARALATRFLERWIAFAEEQQVVALAPAFDQENFGSREGPGGGYRGLFGRQIDADDFVHRMVESYKAQVASFDGRFLLYGHSAGGQFVGRYCVRHPHRVLTAVISAAGRLAFPDPGAPWPYGMGRLQRTMRWNDSEPAKAIDIRPDPDGWLKAAELPITLVVGAADTELLPPRPGQKGTTHVEIAQHWAGAMNQHAQRHHKTGRVRCVVVDGVGHDSRRLTPACQKALLGTR